MRTRVILHDSSIESLNRQLESFDFTWDIVGPVSTCIVSTNIVHGGHLHELEMKHEYNQRFIIVLQKTSG